MTNFEFSDNRKTLIVTSKGGIKYNLYFHRYGIIIGRGFDGNGGTVWESFHVDFSLIPESIRIDIMWTYVEAALASVVDDIISGLDFEMTISNDGDEIDIREIIDAKVGIGRISKNADLVRQYLEERSKTF